MQANAGQCRSVHANVHALPPEAVNWILSMLDQRQKLKMGVEGAKAGKMQG